MQCVRSLAPILVSLLVFGCRANTPSTGPTNPVIADAPYELADADDLAATRDLYDATPRIERAELLRKLTAEYSRRAQAALNKGELDRAFGAFRNLVSLLDHPASFSPVPRELTDQATLARSLLKRYATRGGDKEAALCLYVLALAEPDSAAAHGAELNSIFAFSDDLAVAEHGAGAERSRSLAILESVVDVAPIPAATTRLLALYRERQSAIDDIVRRGELSYEIIGAHGAGVLRTTWHLVRVNALARTLEGANIRLDGVTGFGDDAELREALTKARRDHGPAEAIALAQRFVSDEKEETDLDAARAIIEWALDHTPGNPQLLRAAGLFASKDNKVALGIRLLEESMADELADRDAARELAELYEFRVTTLSLSGRPAAARKALARFESHYKRAAVVWKGFTPDLANAYAAMGRGLLSLGELSTAEQVLGKSLAARETIEAMEHLGTLALRRDQFSVAAQYFTRAINLPAADPSVRFNQTKLRRLAGEALLGAGLRDQAYGMFIRGLEEWRELRSSETFELRPPFEAEALVESGKLLWHIGKRDVALTAFAAAQDVAPGDASTYAAVVSFLVVRDRYSAALDAYHRALGSSKVSDYFKVYMSLWMLAESRRAGIDVDPFVRDFLSSRDGRLWYDALARYASGRSALEPLIQRANTRARRAELLYYSAVLGSTSSDQNKTTSEREALLRDVVATDMIMFFEYEMAKHWLRQGFSK